MTITLTREEAQQVLDALEYGIDYVKSEETTNKQTYKGYEHLCPDDSYYIKFIDDAMETLRTRLAQPEPETCGYDETTGNCTQNPCCYPAPPQLEPSVEPVACIVKDCENHKHQGHFVGDLCSPCHAFITKNEGKYSQAYRNAQREWQGLTDEEAAELCHAPIAVIEAKLKEKNAAD
jgi:hypothetical protein